METSEVSRAELNYSFCACQFYCTVLSNTCVELIEGYIKAAKKHHPLDVGDLLGVEVLLLSPFLLKVGLGRSRPQGGVCQTITSISYPPKNLRFFWLIKNLNLNPEFLCPSFLDIFQIQLQCKWFLS